MQDILTLLKNVGAVMPDDHFVGTSGLHFSTYINKDALYPHTSETSQVGAVFADRLLQYDVDVVAGPALGGIILSQWTTAHLKAMSSKDVLSVYAEKKVNSAGEEELQLTRGYDKLVAGKRVAVVEDLATTGGSLKRVIEAVKKAGGEVVAAAVMVNKDPEHVTSETFGVPFEALAELPVVTYEADACPFCKNGVPVNTSIGHGKKFVESLNK